MGGSRVVKEGIVKLKVEGIPRAEQMMQAMRASLEAIDAKMAEFGVVTKRALGDFKGEMHNATVAARATAEAVKKVEKETEKTGKTAKEISLATSFLAALAAAKQVYATIQRIGTAIVDISTAGAAVEGVEVMFEALAKRAGVDATRAMNDLKEATGGMVSELDLARLAATALSKGAVIEDWKRLGDGLRDVIAIGRTHGKTSAASIRDFTEGLKKGTDEQLKAIGLNLRLEERQRRMAELFGVSSDAMGQQIKSLIVLHEGLAAASEAARDLDTSFPKGEAVDKVTSAWADFKNTLASVATENPAFVQALGDWARLLRDLLEALTPLVQQMGELAAQMRNLSSVKLPELGGAGGLSLGEVGISLVSPNVTQLGRGALTEGSWTKTITAIAAMFTPASPVAAPYLAGRVLRKGLSFFGEEPRSTQEQ